MSRRDARPNAPILEDVGCTIFLVAIGASVLIVSLGFAVWLTS